MDFSEDLNISEDESISVSVNNSEAPRRNMGGSS